MSIEWLRHGLLQEVTSAGFDDSASIYDLEDLSSATLGVIRRKGEHIRCPVDGRLGSSYVHALQETAPSKAVGQATLMLSYGWKYSIGDIVNTLWDYCLTRQLDPESTYVWICCLCNNQHRIAEELRNGNEASFEAFRELFFHRVTGIRLVLAMMAPWDEPVYLTRVWCIFELFAASSSASSFHDDSIQKTKTGDIQVEIVMPPREQEKMKKSISDGGVDRLYEILGKTKVQNANASHEMDKINILQMVESGPGYHFLNARVDDLLRGWVREAIVREIQKPTNTNGEDDASARVLTNVGKLFWKNGEFDQALVCHRKALAFRQAALGPQHEATAGCHNNIGLVLQSMGDYTNSILEQRKAIAILKSSLDLHHPRIADVFSDIGRVLDDTGDSDQALDFHSKSFQIRQALPVSHQQQQRLAESFNDIGVVLQHKGLYDDALDSYQKSLEIAESVHGPTHDATAKCYNNIGSILRIRRDSEGALEYYRKNLATCELLHGKDHADTALAHKNIGWALFHMESHELALEHCRIALATQVSTLGPDHPDATSTGRLIALIRDAMTSEEL